MAINNSSAIWTSQSSQFLPAAMPSFAHGWCSEKGCWEDLKDLSDSLGSGSIILLQYANAPWENPWLALRELLLLSSLFDLPSISNVDRPPPQGLREQSKGVTKRNKSPTPAAPFSCNFFFFFPPLLKSLLSLFRGHCPLHTHPESVPKKTYTKAKWRLEKGQCSTPSWYNDTIPVRVIR